MGGIVPDIIDPVLRLRALEQEALRRGLPLPVEAKRAALEEEAARRGLLTYPTFGSFVAARAPELLEHEYMQRQVSVAERVDAGRIRRLLVLLPTQYGKSTIWSKLFPAYWLLKRPAHMVALASYSAELAWEISSDSRDYYAQSGGRFREGSVKGSMRNWRTLRTRGASGGMWATGIGGAALGRGYNLGVVDDPIDPEQVASIAYQKRFARWWAAKWLRGQRPGGSPIVFVMQRLAINDPVAWMLEREEGGTAEHWHILVMDEIRSDEPFGRWDGPRGFPATCTVEPDPRPIGEVLAPKFRPPAEVEDLQAKSGHIVAAAQRQQRPMRPTGDFWALKWFEDRVYDVLPPDAHDGGWDWDTAYTKDDDNAATAGVKSYRGAGDKKSCRVYIEDVVWDWLEFPDLVKLLLDDLTGPHYVEKKASGKSVAQVLRSHGVPCEEIDVRGNKLERAAAAQPVVSTGGVYINRKIYQKLLYGEHQGLLRITAEALLADRGGLDLNDAFVQALHRHRGLGAPRKRRAAFG